MGWLSRLVHKETDLIQNMFDIEPHLKSLGFTVEKLEDVLHDGVLINRLRIEKSALKLTTVWDGEILSILQKHDLRSDLNWRTYQDFHFNNHYFVLTYGLPGPTLIVKQSIFMSLGTPIVAASLERMLSFWDTHLDLSQILNR